MSGPDRRLRVLFVINGLGTGGAERSLAEMLPGFVDDGLDCEVAVFHRRAEGVQEQVVAAGIPVHFLSPGRRPAQLRSLRQLVRDRRPDLVHTTIFEADVLGRLAGWRSGAPVATSLVNISYGPARVADPAIAPWKLRATAWIDGVTARHLGAGFHAITGAVRDDAVRRLRLAADRVVVIPRGRARSRLGDPSPSRRAEVRAGLGIAEDRLVLVNVGRREFQKGQSTLVRATDLLRSRGLDPLVLIAGRDGGESAALSDLVAELDLGDRVRFVGHVDEVPDLLCAADVFVFPSRFEGLGGSVLEAMALEVPVVATDVPAVAEVLDGGRLGVLVPVDDAAALADGIAATVLDPAATRRRVEAARTEFDQRYTLERVTAAMADWLRSIAAAGGPR